jgi:ABC-type nitrate/sulfonate/bicarbonate transport system ATPase subunit
MFIQFKSVQKSYHGSVVLDGIDLDIGRGEFVSILGPYGSGKTTLLRILSGLLEDYTGSVTINGQAVGQAVANRKIGYCFQRPNLLPWRNVQQNLTVVQEITGQTDPAEIRRLLKMGGLEDYSGSPVNRLSGGMQQVLSILRALVAKPDILLLDEPLSSIDELSREKFQDKLRAIHNKTKKTTVMVTHSIPEAVYLSDKIVVLSSRPATVKKVFKVDSKIRSDRYSAAFNRKVMEIKRCLSDD